MCLNNYHNIKPTRLLGIIWLAVGVFVTAGSFVTASPKGWRGIVPLHSNGDDVQRLLGAPAEGSFSAYYYRLPNETVVFQVQPFGCNESPGTYGYGWNVRPGTVTGIGVIPAFDSRKEKYLQIRKARVEHAGAGLVYYTDESEGVTVETYLGKVTKITYSPTIKDRSLQCPRVEEGLVESFQTFDEYGNISFADERARLDNYAFHLRAALMRGVLIAYGRNPAQQRQTITRAKRARNYLVHKQGIEPRRIIIVNGRYRDLSSIQLNAYPIAELGRIYLEPAHKRRVNKR